MKTENILLYTLGHKDYYFEGKGYKIPIPCWGMEKSIVYNLDYLKKYFKVNLILFGLNKLPLYSAQDINIISGGKSFNSYTLSYIFSFKDLITNFPFGIKNISEKDTVIMVHNFFLLVIFSKLFTPKIKVILFIENEVSRLLWRLDGNIFSKIIYFLITFLGLILADKIIKVSDRTCWLEDKLNFIKKKSYYLPNGLDIKIFKPYDGNRNSLININGVTDKDSLLLYVGRITDTKYKNPRLLFKSFEAVRKKKSNIKLIVIGTGKEEGYRLLKKHNVKNSENIFFMGIIKNESIIPYYQRCDLTLLTSRSEGNPYVILESLACGTPCVTTDVINKHTIQNGVNGYVSKSQEVEDFTNVMLKGLELSLKLKPQNKSLLDPIYNIKNREKNLLKLIQ